MHFDEDAWDDLLNYIEERRVIPIIGPELLRVQTDQGLRPLHEWLAEKLAARLSVSEAALYRHFASKAQMFEGLIDFIEQAVFTRVTQIVGRDPVDAAQPAEGGAHQAARVVALLLQFGERNPGLVRVMVGDALVLEHERLQQRMNQFFERIESSLRQCLRAAAGAARAAYPPT